MFQIVLVLRDGDTKTCLGETLEEVKSKAKRIAERHGCYVACFLPRPCGIIPTTAAKKLAEDLRRLVEWVNQNHQTESPPK